MIEARALIGERAGLMAKIEKPAALERIDDIIQMSDAIMVARGDLGVEIPHEGIHSTALSDHTSPAARWLPIDPSHKEKAMAFIEVVPIGWTGIGVC